MKASNAPTADMTRVQTPFWGLCCLKKGGEPKEELTSCKRLLLDICLAICNSSVIPPPNKSAFCIISATQQQCLLDILSHSIVTYGTVLACALLVPSDSDLGIRACTTLLTPTVTATTKYTQQTRCYVGRNRVRAEALHWVQKIRHVQPVDRNVLSYLKIDC